MLMLIKSSRKLSAREQKLVRRARGTWVLIAEDPITPYLFRIARETRHPFILVSHRAITTPTRAIEQLRFGTNVSERDQMCAEVAHAGIFFGESQIAEEMKRLGKRVFLRP